MAFAGFDCSSYPGDHTMQSLKSDTNLCFVGFYLAPAPCHPDDGWMSKRTFLTGLGWGLVPVYVGQQEAGASPCQACNLTSAQGGLDGKQAAGLMASAGFPQNSVVYVDCEQGGPASHGVLAYVGAWVDAVAANAYTPGIYCSHTTAASLLAIRPNVRVWAWKITSSAPGPTFPTNAPDGSGVSQATVWQYCQNATVTFPAAPTPITLNVDLNCAAASDPSQP
jgi:hypothetical protein